MPSDSCFWDLVPRFEGVCNTIAHMAPWIIISLERISKDHQVFSWAGLILSSSEVPTDLTGQPQVARSLLRLAKPRGWASHTDDSVIRVYRESGQATVLLACQLAVIQQTMWGMSSEFRFSQHCLFSVAKNQAKWSQPSFPSHHGKKSCHSCHRQQYIPVSQNHPILSWSRSQNKVLEKKKKKARSNIEETLLKISYSYLPFLVIWANTILLILFFWMWILETSLTHSTWLTAHSTYVWFIPQTHFGTDCVPGIKHRANCTNCSVSLELTF